MSRKPGTGFCPTLEELEDRTALSAASFRSNLPTFFPSVLPSAPGKAANLPSTFRALPGTVIAPATLSTPGVPLPLGPSVVHPSIHALLAQRGEAITLPSQSGNVAAPLVFVPHTTTNFTTPGVFVPHQTDPGLSTVNLNLPSLTPPPPPPTHDPTLTTTGMPWWTFM